MLKSIDYKEIEATLHHLSREERYELLLKTNEWKNFRRQIVIRDSHTCTVCSDKEGFKETFFTKDELKEREEQVKKSVMDHLPLKLKIYYMQSYLNPTIDFNKELEYKNFIINIIPCIPDTTLKKLFYTYTH